MMARARNIKPSFFINEELVECHFATRLLFIGLWTLADREGRLEDKPKKIKMALFPADNLDIEFSLNELVEHGFIVRYEIQGEKYIQVLAFKKHQNPHRDEKASTIPAKFSNDADLNNEDADKEKHSANTVQTQCEDDADTVAIGLIPDSLLLIPDSLGEQSNVSENCNGEEVGKEPPRPLVTSYGLVARALIEAGMHTLNQSNPTFTALVDAGATAQEFVDAYLEQKSKNKKCDFNYILAKVSGRREDAAKLNLHKGQLPATTSRESGRQVAASSVFTPENTQHLQGVQLKTINEVIYEQTAITA
jgi:hypothetical protein